MGLDLTIREERNFRTNESGHRTWDTVELCNLRNCWRILEKLSDRLENGFSNCSTVSFCEGTFFAILHELEEEDKIETRSRNNVYEINALKEFIKENELTEEVSEKEDTDIYGDESYGRTFEVHAWW